LKIVAVAWVEKRKILALTRTEITRRTKCEALAKGIGLDDQGLSFEPSEITIVFISQPTAKVHQ
jgi:hypothetical protein